MDELRAGQKLFECGEGEGGVMGILLQKETQSLDAKWAKKGYNWV